MKLYRYSNGGWCDYILRQQSVIILLVSLYWLSIGTITGFSQKPTADLSAQIRVITEPAEALVFCDGEMKGVSPVTIADLPAGEHLIVVRKDGYYEARKTLVVSTGQRLPVEIKMEPVTGLVLLHSEPSGASVFINGALRGTTPLLLTDLPLGRYRAKFQLAGYSPIEIELVVPNRTPIKRTVQLTSDTASLTVSSTPGGAIVNMDGIPKGVTPCTLDRIQAGEHLIEVNQPGYQTYKETIKLAAGERAQINVFLKPVPATLVVVSVPPKARVYVNSEYRGETPLTLENLEPGSYRVRAEMAGYEPLFRNVELKPGKKVTEEFRLEATSGTIVITTEPPEVKVLLDGKEAGVTARKAKETTSEPLTIEQVTPGGHEIELVKKGYYPMKISVEVEKNKETRKHVKLRRQFLPDYEVVTVDGVVYRGVKHYIDAEGNIRIEIAEGVFRTIPRNQIKYHRPLQ